MLKSNAYSRALQLSADILGSAEALAAFLGVTKHELMQWLSGSDLPSFAIYSSAMDIVSAGRVADLSTREYPRHTTGRE